MPDAGEHLWVWFNELQRTRQMTQAGLQALTYGEIMAWSMLTDRQVLPHEVTALLDLDLTFRAAM